MAEHLIEGEFQSDKYPTTPRGKVPLSCKDVTAQDLLWEYAQRRRVVDADFADDLETALHIAGYKHRTAPRDAGERHRKAAEEIVSQYLDHIGEWNAGAATDKIAAIIARLTQKEPTETPSEQQFREATEAVAAMEPWRRDEVRQEMGIKTVEP